MPESLPAVDHIKHAQKRLKPSMKKWLQKKR
jgi:hypothetical protein